MADKIEDRMNVLQGELYNILPLESREDLLLSSAILMKTAVELYTIIFSDKAIEDMLRGEVIDSIPQLRKKMEGALKPTVH
jgi:hypothetical protein|tara:strand:+ start:280 stop:522 length:243 start_codon:yes stop_codon:yes gene_type:complete